MNEVAAFSAIGYASAVPEPSTLALVGASVIGLIGLRGVVAEAEPGCESRMAEQAPLNHTGGAFPCAARPMKGRFMELRQSG